MPETSDGVVKRSIVVAGHRTSVSMEQLFWDQLKRIAEREATSVAAVIARIDGERGRQNLSSAIRVFVLEQALRAPPAAEQAT